jgi:hypothetical protein
MGIFDVWSSGDMSALSATGGECRVYGCACGGWMNRLRDDDECANQDCEDARR